MVLSISFKQVINEGNMDVLLDIADSLERKDLREKVLKYAGNYTLDGCGLWWCDLFIIDYDFWRILNVQSDLAFNPYDSVIRNFYNPNSFWRAPSWIILSGNAYLSTFENFPGVESARQLVSDILRIARGRYK